MHEQKSNVVKWSLIFGIVIVLNLFFNYALSLVYVAPDYNAYFPPNQEVKQDTPATQQLFNQQEQQFDAAEKNYDKSVFIILVLLGVASIIVGMLFANEVLSIAFSWGGVLSLVIASMRYWSDANNILKVIILAIALGGLIWVAIKKFT